MTLIIGGSLAATWLRGGSWRRADSRVEDLFTLDFYRSIAVRAERAHLDFLFAPDALFLDTSMIDESPGFSSLDSFTVATAMASVTSRIGVIPTTPTAFADPYSTARQVQSLNRLSQGRAGWNVVTSLGGFANFGIDTPPESVQRYQRAAEFIDVARKLWHSYPGTALIRDRQSGQFADPNLVLPINHAGEYFQVAGPLTVPSLASDPPILQAGASEPGRDFAGRYADAVFISTPTVEQARANRVDLQQRAAKAGREPSAIKVLPGLSLFLGETRAQARELMAEAHRGRTRPGANHWTIVGTVTDAATEIEQWVGSKALDGFILFPGGCWGSLDLAVEVLIPELAARGLYRSEYTETTLRGHLGLPSDSESLPEPEPARHQP